MKNVSNMFNRVMDFMYGVKRECDAHKDACVLERNESAKMEPNTEGKGCDIVSDTRTWMYPTTNADPVPQYYGYHDDKPDRWGHS